MRSRRIPTIATAALAVGLLWSYWPTLEALVSRWETDSRYSHGYLVPGFSLALLWIRRGRLGADPMRANWGGVPLIALGVAIRLAGTYLHFEWLETVSLLPTLAGICVVTAGWPALGWAWPSIAFLAFAIPLPYGLETSMGWPLQRFATEVSTSVLQTLGFPAVAEGNVITIDDWQLGVVEACNGMGMMLLFFAFSTGAALLIHRPLLDRLLIVASAVPIALASNVARITTTGILHELLGDGAAHFVYHDLAGWLMMPIAMALLGVVLWLLSLLFVPVASPEKPDAGSQAKTGPAAPARRPEPIIARPATVPET